MKKTTKSNNSPKAIIQAFTYGKLTNAKLYEHPLCKKDRSLFYYRIQCSFMSGQKKIIQTAYVTREELLSQRSFYEKQVEEKKLCIFKCSVKDFFEYWLSIYLPGMKIISSARRIKYKDLIYRYIIPKIGPLMMNNITENDLQKLLGSTNSREDFDDLCHVLVDSFETALEYHCTDHDPASAAVQLKNDMVQKLSGTSCERNLFTSKDPEVQNLNFIDPHFNDEDLLKLMR